MSIPEAELTRRVIEWVRAHKLTSAPSNGEITEDTDLLATGLLDSFGFVELILFLESENGCRVDLTDVDPSEFAVVKGLCRVALRNYA